jgi:thiol-disulfide isomerase/thioredoxin
MVFLHINKETVDKFKDDKKNVVTQLNNFLHNKKVFLLIYMEGCGPCNMVRPEWKKLENVLKDRQDIVIVDIDKNYVHKFPSISSPNSFPTIRYITNKGKTLENYEDSDIKRKDRSVDSFVEWINTKLKEKNKKNNKTHKNSINGGKKTKSYRGGRWSLKYKRSINCKKPKGFSQKQYCKYGRRK